MLRSLNPASSFSRLFVSRSAFLSFIHFSFSSSSKKMEGRRTPNEVRTNLDFRSGRQSPILGNSSSNNNIGRSSSPSHSQRSRFPQPIENQRMQTSKKAIGACPGRSLRGEPEKGPFDICRPANVGLVKLKDSFLAQNRAKKRELELAKTASTIQYLRPGMILLKNFICHMDQVKIVSKCRELGISSGGFYRPGYRDGAKLNLQMMCLGKDWNPETRSYDKSRPFDGAVSPEIPVEFKKLVDGALIVSHAFLKEKEKKVEEIPQMSPDICIVNFYTDDGRLGLHQDRDESDKSLNKGLPVVSFSIGNSAEFLYSDVRDVDKAEKVMLESGDVLIFGGLSRHIFHGVSCINPNTAPKFLDEQAKLRPGRLNLTFRQF